MICFYSLDFASFSFFKTLIFDSSFRKEDIILTVNDRPAITHRDTVDALKSAGLVARLVSLVFLWSQGQMVKALDLEFDGPALNANL